MKSSRTKHIAALLLASGALLAAACVRFPPANVSYKLPASGAVRPVKILEQGDYSEGVVLDREGNLYFSHGKIVTVVSPDGSHRTWAETGQPNGHKILTDGTHLICDASRHAVLRLDADGELLKPAATECDGTPLRGPNDLSVDPRGGFYFTDPGGSSDDKPIGTVHYVDPDGKTHLVDEGLAFPNGIAIHASANRLFVAESKRNRILVYDVTEAGKVGPRREFAQLPSKEGDQTDNQPDGICLDLFGNLYIAHYGMRQVQVLDRNGQLIRRYHGGNLRTSNVAFAGAQMDELYVTGGEPDGETGAFYRLDLPGAAGLDIRPRRPD